MSDSAPCKRKPLLPDVASVQENLESFRFKKQPKQRDLHLGRGMVFRRTRFDPVAHPIADARVLDVLKFRADGVGINLLEQRDHLAQRHFLIVEKEFRRDLEIEILLAETEFAQT